MILTICPNPSIDCTVELPSIDIGKVNRIDNKVLTYSGKALNVAIGVSRLGGDAFSTGFMFEKDCGQFLKTLDAEKVKNDFVVTEGSVRINYKIIDNHSMMTEINDRGECVSLEKQAELVEKSAYYAKNASIAVMSGSLPKGVDDDFYYKLIKAMPAGVKIAVDCEGEKLKKALSAGVYLVKPNLAELENFMGEPCRGISGAIKGALKMIEKGAENVLLSLGREGALLTDGKTHLYCRSANVAVNSTVGAGDCALAAACVKIEAGASREEILRSAVAAGTASITTPGTGLFYKDKYEEIYNAIYVESVK